MNIDLLRYAGDKSCATPDGLKAKLLADLKPVVAKIHMQTNRIIVAGYVATNMTPGGIMLPPKTVEENRWQNKCGLVLKLGPLAYRYDEVTEWMYEHMTATGETTAKAWRAAFKHFGLANVGDWVLYRGAETHEVGMQVAPGVAASCRFINDNSIIAKIDDPTLVY